jgi:hypothetical protein
VVPGLEGGKTWWDLCGLNPGTLTNMTTSASGWRGTTRPGGWGHVLCDGSNDSVNCGNGPALGITGNLTLSLWMRLDAQPVGAYSVFTKDKDTGGRTFTLDYHNNGVISRLRWYINGGAGSNLIADAATLNTGQWYHVAATYATSGTLAIYVNGLLRVSGSGADTSLPTSTANVTLGAREYAGNQDYMPGALDGAQMRARTLTAAEVKALYDESRQGYPNLLRYAPGVTRTLTPGPPSGGLTQRLSFILKQIRIGRFK